MRGSPFKGLAPDDYEVIETMSASDTAVLAQRLNQTRPAADPDITELAGVIVDKYFQSGRAVARVDVPGIGRATLKETG